MKKSSINNTAELISVAIAAEHSAVLNYSKLASKMHQYGNQDAANLFERMCKEESHHEKHLYDWAKRENYEIDINVAQSGWELPGTAQVYDMDAQDPAKCTPYKALAFAVHNEERAFQFYSYIAAHTKSDEVRKFAEDLAHEELGHASLLRALRRREWHKERKEPGNNEPKINPSIISEIPDLLSIAYFFENTLLVNIERARADLPELDTAKEVTRNILNLIEAKQSDNEPPAVDVTEVLASIRNWNASHKINSGNPSLDLLQLCSDSDRNFSFYDSIVISTQDEEVMLLAQELCSRSLDRVSAMQTVDCDKS